MERDSQWTWPWSWWCVAEGGREGGVEGMKKGDG